VTGDVCFHWFWGELPARWLSRQGIYLNTIHLKLAAKSGPGDQRGASAVDQGAVDAALAKYIPAAARRLGDSQMATMMLAGRARPAGEVLMSCDDDWWHPRPWLPFGPAYEEAVRNVEAGLRAAAGIVVPSARLAELVQPFGRHVTVIPPALPPCADWPVPRAAHHETGLRIGFVGTSQHWGDLAAVGPAMLQFLARHPDVTVVLGGGAFRGSWALPWATDHPQVERYHPGWVLLPGYYRFIASLDLDGFICPLVDCEFDRAKPCLKPLEAAMLGLPVIASAVGSYAEDLEHEETALLVPNTTAAWLTALTRLVDDADLRAHLSARGQAWAATRTIDSTGPLWAKVWAAA